MIMVTIKLPNKENLYRRFFSEMVGVSGFVYIEKTSETVKNSSEMVKWTSTYKAAQVVPNTTYINEK